MKTTRSRLLLASAVLALTSVPAAADMLLLADGRVVEGVTIRKQEDGYHLQYKNGEVVVPCDRVKDCFVEAGEGPAGASEEDRAKLAKGLVPYEGKWVPRAERDAKEAKRRAAQKQRVLDAKAHREWRNRYKDKSPNFLWEYTVPPEVARGYVDLMETYYSVFTKYWGVQRPPKEPKLPVCLYRDYDSFLQTSGAGRGVLAYYRFVPPRELNFYYDRLDPEETVAIMFHEANHYLSNLIDLGFSYPHCLGEAMAEYYGGSLWDPVKKQMSLGHVQDGRLTEVMTDMQGGEEKRLEAYLKDELGYDDYTWGWSFVHFMMETPKYQPKFRKFFLAIARDKEIPRVGDGVHRTVAGPEILKAFKRIMGVDDLAPLEKEWYEHVKGLQFGSVRGYEQAGLAAMRTEREIKAEKYFKLALEKGTKNPVVFLRYAELLLWKDRAQEAVDLLKKGLPFDPLNAQMYAALGRATARLEGAGRKEEGKRYVELAREIDPDEVEFEFLLDEIREKAGGEGGMDGGDGGMGGDGGGMDGGGSAPGGG